MHISSIMDTWIVVRNVRSETELTRRLHVVKARGMAHSSQVQRMEITSAGVRLTDFSASPHASAGAERMAPDKSAQPELPEVSDGIYASTSLAKQTSRSEPSAISTASAKSIWKGGIRSR